jgi:hypothetical protein
VIWDFLGNCGLEHGFVVFRSFGARCSCVICLFSDGDVIQVGAVGRGAIFDKIDSK